MSSFARSFSRLTTSLLECPDVDEEEAPWTPWMRMPLDFNPLGFGHVPFGLWDHVNHVLIIFL